MIDKIEISDRAFMGAQIRSSSLNEAARTVDVIFSTGAAVKRYSWDEGCYMEELDMAPSSVDLARLNAGASFLDTHDQSGMASRLGAVQPGSARIEGGKGVATITLSTSPSGEQILSDLRAGLPLPVSVGYRIHEYSKIEGDGDQLPTYRALRWEPLEISAVPVPADFGAQARADQNPQRHAVPVTNTVRRAQGGADLENVSMTTANDSAEALERTRTDQIMLISENHSIPLRLARKAMIEGKTVEQFREMCLDHKRSEIDKNYINPIAPHDRGYSDMPLSEALADAVGARVSRGFKPADGAKPYIGLSVAEMARRALEARGINTGGMSPNRLVERGLNTTTDFPIALNLAGSRELARAYEAAPAGLKAIAKKTTARDFRPKATIVLAGNGQLIKVNEHGEFKRASFVEGVESYALSSFGRIFSISRQALVNDDLGIFADMPGKFGRAASEFEATFLATTLEANGRMGDGVEVFHASHSNLAATGSLLSIASLSAARLAMRTQTDANGDLVTIVPKFLIVPPALETTAQQLLATIAPTTTAQANPFSGTLELIVEPRLKSATAWYLAGDPAQYPCLEYAHIEGEEGPRQDQRVGFDIDGVEFKIALDFGAAILDHRGLYKNPGIAA